MGYIGIFLKMLILYIIFHIICGIIAAGILLAYIQKEFSAIALYFLSLDRIFCWSLGLLGGPVALAVALLSTDWAKCGLQWK